MKIKKLSSIPQDSLFEHLIIRFLEGNGPTDEDTVMSAMKEFDGYVTGAAILELVYEGKILASWDKNEKVLKFRENR